MVFPNMIYILNSSAMISEPFRGHANTTCAYNIFEYGWCYYMKLKDECVDMYKVNQIKELSMYYDHNLLNINLHTP